MQPRADLVPAKKHDAEEACFHEEGRQHFVSHQRSYHRPGDAGEGRPVGSELVGKHDARDHAHAEGEGKKPDPELIEAPPQFIAGLQPSRFDEDEKTRNTDRQGREDNVE